MNTAIRALVALAPLLAAAACSATSNPATDAPGQFSLGTRHTEACGTGSTACADESGAHADAASGVNAGECAGDDEADAGDAGPGDAGPGDAGGGATDDDAGSGGAVPDGGASSDDSGVDPAFRACHLDADCVAAPRVGCCQNGWMVAVARGQVDSYEASFTCPEARPICPMYRVLDSRVAECDRGTLLCTLVPIDEILCGGFIRNAHVCPDGYQCDFQGHVPDVPGRCVSVTDAESR